MTKEVSIEIAVNEYEICKVRGHVASGMVTCSMPPQNICQYCRTYYYYTEPQLVEVMGPAIKRDEQ